MRKRKKRQKRFYGVLALILALAAAFAGVTPFVFSHFAGEDARLIQDGGEADGRLRVLLKSLGERNRLTLTLDGMYSLESDPGFRFARGSVLTLAVQDSSIWLDCAGLTIDMGPKFTLTRHKAEDGEPNGIYISESEKPNIYNGDLCLEAKNGTLSALLYIDMEEYLYGVVPYEMSDSWPLEALKAQAVAARTYAMGRKSARVNSDYDLVDTTADQVFKGFSGDTVNAIAAVDSTAGIVGMYKGSFATCYYGASNGGQTAMPDEIWGREGDYDYLAVKEDPYDLENPLSVVRFMDIPADGGAMDETLSSLLKAALSEQLSSMGYSEDAEDIRITGIESVVPFDPKGREGSRMAQTLRFTLRVEARPWIEQPGETAEPAEPSPAPAESDPAAQTTSVPVETAAPLPILGDFTALDAPLEADIGLYTQIKTSFDAMDINSSDCELYTVVQIHASGKESIVSIPQAAATETEAPEENAQEDAVVGYRLEARRFGHGVGMSQRGAQTMAGQHDLSYTDILLFYYPNMDLVRYAIPASELVAQDELPKGMGVARVVEIEPSPTPAPLPPIEEGESYGVVELGSVSSALNVRSEPNTSCEILSTLEDGQRVIICEKLDGWYAIRTAETSGYVSADYLIEE